MATIQHRWYDGKVFFTPDYYIQGSLEAKVTFDIPGWLGCDVNGKEVQMIPLVHIQQVYVEGPQLTKTVA